MHFIAPQLATNALQKSLSVYLGKHLILLFGSAYEEKKNTRTLFDWEELVLEQSETLSHG